MTQLADASRKWTLAEKGLAVISALLAVATAYLGLQTAKVAQAKERAQTAVATKDTDLSSLQDQFNQLQSRYAQLQAENEQLKSQLGLPGPTADPQPTPGATVRHSGQLVLVDGGPNANLDSPSSDPQWQTGFLDSDLGIVPGTMVLYGDASALYLGDTKADYSTCRGRTGYSSNRIDFGILEVGKYLCVKTEEKRYSALRITSLSPTQVAFDVVTYDPPDR